MAVKPPITDGGLLPYSIDSKKVISRTAFVILLDVLGVKGLSDERQKWFLAIIEFLDTRVIPGLLQCHVSVAERYFKEEDIIVNAIGDTIEIVIPLRQYPDGIKIAQHCFFTVSEIVSGIVCTLIHDGFLTRGAIGFGNVYILGQRVVGKAVDDAVCEYEATKWCGVHFAEAATGLFAEWRSAVPNIGQEPHADTDYERMAVLLSSGRPKWKEKNRKDARLICNWPMYMQARIDHDYATPLDLLLSVLEHLKRGAPRRALPIYENTVRFVNSYYRQFPKLNVYAFPR